MTEGIIIDGIKYFKQCDINKGLNEEHYVTEFHLLAKHYNLLLEDYARKYNSLKEQIKRKEQECEELKKQHEQYKPFYELGAKCTQLNEVADGLSNKCDKYKQALDEIEEYINSFPDFVKEADKIILDIIKKVKAVSNAR